jgi:hypothetical protein
MGLKITQLSANAVHGVLDSTQHFDMRRVGDQLSARIGERRFSVPARDYRSASDMRACAYSVLAQYRAETKATV